MLSSFQDQRPWIIAPSDDYSSTLCGLDGGLCFGNTTGCFSHSTGVLTESSLFQPKTTPQTFIAIRSTPLLLLPPAPLAYMWIWMIGKLTRWASTRVLLPFIIQTVWLLTHYSNEQQMQRHSWCTIRPSNTPCSCKQVIPWWHSDHWTATWSQLYTPHSRRYRQPA